MSLIDNEYLNRTFNFVNDYEIIEGSESSYYNCISHSIGIYNRWSWSKIVDNNNYWPISNINETIEAFDEFYKYHGYKPISINSIYTGENKIALYSI